MQEVVMAGLGKCVKVAREDQERVQKLVTAMLGKWLREQHGKTGKGSRNLRWPAWGSVYGSSAGGPGKGPETRNSRAGEVCTGVAREDKERVQKLLTAGLGKCVRE